MPLPVSEEKKELFSWLEELQYSKVFDTLQAKLPEKERYKVTLLQNEFILGKTGVDFQEKVRSLINLL